MNPAIFEIISDKIVLSDAMTPDEADEMAASLTELITNIPPEVQLILVSEVTAFIRIESNGLGRFFDGNGKLLGYWTVERA